MPSRYPGLVTVLCTLCFTLCLHLALPETATAREDASAIENTWDLTVLFNSPKAWDKERKKILKNIERIQDKKGSIKDAGSLLQVMDFYMLTLRKAMPVAVYASLQKDEDLGDAEAQERHLLVTNLWGKFSEASAWMAPEILSLGEANIQAFLEEEPGLETYRFELDNILRTAPHTLDDATEQALSYFSPAMGSPRNIYNALAYDDIEWPEVMLSSGEEVILDDTGYKFWRRAENREDRKKVFDAYWGAWHSYQNTVGTVLNAHIQNQVARSKARKYPSVLYRELYNDNLPETVYTTLVKEVNRALPTLHRYFRLRTRMLGIDQMHYYDIYPHLVSLDKEFDYETSKRITLEAMTLLGEDWVSQQRAGMSARWAHVYPSKGKRGGAYMQGSAYDAHPFLLLNHKDDFSSLSTLAHEWGHAMHRLYARSSQPFHSAGYSLFIGEIPSTSLELILEQHLLDQTSNVDEQIFYLSQGLEAMRGTFFRQTMFAEFELWLYETVEKGEALTGKKMTDKYLELLKHYHGHDKKVVIIDDLYANEWMFIRHFYRNMYVFQYATSITAGTALYQKILDEGEAGVQNFKDLLRAGSSDYPHELLKKAGVDMTTRAPYKAIVKRMNDTMDQIESLLDVKARKRDTP